MKINTIANQTLLDIAIQEHGDVTSVFAIALQNNLSVTAALSLTQEVVINKENTKNIDVYNYYFKQAIKPASKASVTSVGLQPNANTIVSVIKPSTVLVASNQTLFDIAIQATGTATNVVALALKNNRSITANLMVGDVLDYKNIETNVPVLAYYNKYGIKPATGKNLINIISTYAEKSYVKQGYWK